MPCQTSRAFTRAKARTLKKPTKLFVPRATPSARRANCSPRCAETTSSSTNSSGSAPSLLKWQTRRGQRHPSRSLPVKLPLPNSRPAEPSSPSAVSCRPTKRAKTKSATPRQSPKRRSSLLSRKGRRSHCSTLRPKATRPARPRATPKPASSRSSKSSASVVRQHTRRSSPRSSTAVTSPHAARHSCLTGSPSRSSVCSKNISATSCSTTSQQEWKTTSTGSLAAARTVSNGCNRSTLVTKSTGACVPSSTTSAKSMPKKSTR